MTRIPSLSVIITNHNYSNYLAVAIESVLAQTKPALDIIVVDDGSTDGSWEILKAYQDRVTVVTKPVGGQASAFNAGYAAARGELIYFLDADDVAGPYLVETVTSLWHQSLAAICFALELVGADGRHMGVYDVLPTDMDNRPGFVNTGGFTFLPTSGNVFSRAALDRIMPLDEPRWRISADAVLLRAATVAGRVMPLRQTLAAYRIHAHNNYYVQGASDLWRDRRDMRDVTDLADAFAASPRYFGHAAGLSRRERRERDREALALMTGGLRFRIYRAGLFDDSHGAGRALWRLARRFLVSDLPLVARLGLATTAAAASFGAPRSALLRFWIAEPGARPAIVGALLRMLGHNAYVKLTAPSRNPRWCVPLAIGRTYALTEAVDGYPMLRKGWRLRPQPGAIYMQQDIAVLSLWLDPSPGAYTVRLTVSPLFGPLDSPLSLSVALAGNVLVDADIDQTATVNVPLQAGTAAAGGEVNLELRLMRRSSGRLRERLARIFAARPTLALQDVTLCATEPMPRSAYAGDGTTRPFSDLLAGMEGKGFLCLSSGEGELRAPSGEACVSVYQPHTPISLTLDLPSGQPAGLMRITQEGSDLFHGHWGATRRLQLEIPRSSTQGYALVTLRFDFTPDDLCESRRPRIASVRFHRRREGGLMNSADHVADVPCINPGQHLRFEQDLSMQGALAKGWHFDEEGTAVALDGTAEIAFRMPFYAAPSHGLFQVSPVLEPHGGLRHVLGIFCGNISLAKVVLEGPSEIEVPFEGVLAAGQGLVKITLHSFLVKQDDPLPRPAALRLEGITFSKIGQVYDESDISSSLMETERYGGELEERLRAVGVFLDTVVDRPAKEAPDDAALATLLDHRAAVGKTIARLGDRGLASALVNPETLRRIGRLAAATEDSFPIGLPHEVPLGCWPDDPQETLRPTLLALAGAPVWKSPAFADLAGFPSSLLWHVPILADILTRSPLLIPEPQQRESYVDFMERLIASADDLLGHAAPGSAQHRLAAAVIRQARPRHVLFGDGTGLPLVRTLGRAIERLLHQEGYPLAWHPPATGSRDRLRVGIIVRAWTDEPETRIAKGNFTPSDPRVQPIRIILGESDACVDKGDFEETINLAGLDVGDAVACLRAARLDVLLLGSYFVGLDRLAAIVAHRLAPVQLATAAVSPASTGLSAFDAILTNEELDPSEATPGYYETLHRLALPIQRFADRCSGNSRTPMSRTQIRLLAGLPLEATVYVSGAMAQKIGTDLLDAYARILERVPDGILALYPFAANWRTTFAPQAFRSLVDKALTARNVACGRVVVMPPLDGEGVSNLLAAADVYLDSFPYAGATTVVEALEQRCPVVALEGRTQRARQGAAWLRRAGLAANVAQSVDSYVERAILLGTDHIAREDMRARISAYIGREPAYRSNQAFARVLADHLIQLAKDRGIHLSPARVRPPQSHSAKGGARTRYVYHHMPKTAGTAAKSVFRSHFRLRGDYREKWSPVHENAPYDLDDLTEKDLLCGHFELPETRIERRYPALFREPGWRVFTFVREPLDLALSNYFFERERRQEDPDFIDVGLSAYLRGEKDNYLEHFDYQDGDWRARLDRYWFVGSVERLDESLTFLADAWNCELPPVTVENATARSERPDPDDVEIFLRNHQTAYDIYNEVRRRLDALLH